MKFFKKYPYEDWTEYIAMKIVIPLILITCVVILIMLVTGNLPCNSNDYIWSPVIVVP